MKKLDQCNEMLAKLQEMTIKHVEKYTGLFPVYTLTLNQARRETKYQTECVDKDVKTHPVEKRTRN